MNTDNEFDPMARLRAADPGAGVESRSGFVEEVIERTLGEPALAPAPTADLAAERARRRRPWLPVAAVAASIAIVGGVGFGVGAATGGGTNLADGAAPPISLGGGTEQTAGEDGALSAGGVPGGTAERLAMPGAGIADMVSPYGFGRNSFRASGLSATAGSAIAYAFDARSVSNAESVSALAAALGVEGIPELKDGAWTVGPQDGSAPSLSVGLDGSLGFYFSDPSMNPWECSGATDGDIVAEPCVPVGDPPSAEAAIGELRSLIAATGRDAGAFEFASETWEGSPTRFAQAWPVVDGQRVDPGWSLELTGAGVFSASGALAEIVALGDYAIVSEQEGFERLSDPRFGATTTNLPIALREQSTVAEGEWVPPTEPPATPVAGSPLAWHVNHVEIVGARLGLASHWQPDGSVLVVPAYEFTDAEGGTWSVVAVADSMLDFASE